MDTKLCWKCKLPKPLGDFHNDKSRHDGKCHTCKKCMKEYQDDHKENSSRNSSNHYRKNKTKVNARNAQWKIDNYDRKLEKDREWRLNNKDHIKELHLAWRIANRDYLRSKYRIQHLKRKYGITEDMFWQLFDRQNGLCGVCSIPLSESKSICVDHCHSAGYIRGLLCHKCNCAEGMLGTIENVERLLAYMRKNELFYYKENSNWIRIAQHFMQC